MTATQTCMLCNESFFVELPYSYLYKGAQITLIQCTSCGIAMLSPMLPEDEIISLYNKEYFEKDYHCGISKRTYAEEVKHIRREFRPFLSMIRTFQPTGKYLEIGCAGGAALAEAKEKGFNTIGVELFPEIAEWGRQHLKLDIRTGTLHDQRFPDNFFDVVYLGDVIEHLLKPKDVLHEIHRVLKQSGIIALAYPMELNHIVPRLRKLFNLQKQSPNKPYHLFSFNILTMSKLLERCCFEVKLHKISKIIRHQPSWTYIIDSLNFVLTILTSKYGDRGFTIASVSKKDLFRI